MAIIPDKVAQFVADVDIAHAIIHGPASGAESVVSTDNGLVRTLSRAVAEGGATAAEVAALRLAIESLSTADLSDWNAATADFLTAADLPAAPVTSVAGRAGVVTLQTSDLTDWIDATAGFGGGVQTGGVPRPDDGAGRAGLFRDYFTTALDTAGVRFTGAVPWRVESQLAGDVVETASGGLVLFAGGDRWAHGILGVEQPVPAGHWRRRVSVDVSNTKELGGGSGYYTGMYLVGPTGKCLSFPVTQVHINYVLKSNRQGSNLDGGSFVSNPFGSDVCVMEIECDGSNIIFRLLPSRFYHRSQAITVPTLYQTCEYMGGVPQFIGLAASVPQLIVYRAFDGENL